jgi:hypothetical protein
MLDSFEFINPFPSLDSVQKTILASVRIADEKPHDQRTFDHVTLYTSPWKQHPFSLSVGNAVPSGSTKRVNTMQTQQTTPYFGNFSNSARSCVSSNRGERELWLHL